MTHPSPPQDALPRHLPDRRASWFELFFDLVFVVAVAQLNSTYVQHYDLAGAVQFAFGFLTMWWCWLGHTFYATRFDQDTTLQRSLGLMLILTVAWFGYGAADYAGALPGVFASGIAAFKLLLCILYAIAWRWPGARPMIRFYATLYLLQSVLWALSIKAAANTRWELWSVALLLDLLSPWLAARHAHEIPPHPEHLPERFGLFTIILLGESMASAVHALGHGAEPAAQAQVAAVGGSLLTFLIWVAYFERTRSHQGRHIATASDGLLLRFWAFAHLPLYLGVASLAAGTMYLSEYAVLSRSGQLLFTAGTGLLMLGLVVLSATRRNAESAAVALRPWRHLLLGAASMLLLTVVDLAHPVALLMATGAAFLIQLAAAHSRTSNS